MFNFTCTNYQYFKAMRKILIFPLVLIIISVASCKKEEEFPPYLKGLVTFKPYNLNSGAQKLMYADREIRFLIDMELATTAKNVDVVINYHLLDGTLKIGEGKARVNILLDAGLGIRWGSNENYIPIDAIAMKGKTLTVYLDPENKYTADYHTNPWKVDAYKKARITIP